MLEQSNVGGLDRCPKYIDGHLDVDFADTGDLEAPSYEETEDWTVLQLSLC
jgi:hypothetical protein